ncbi:MAG: NADH-quinone oxidoreductase subunit M [Bacteroidota bacterium]|nr:NADH-quinone oxidoreductase subunit M [Bacteroidota bacterium]
MYQLDQYITLFLILLPLSGAVLSAIVPGKLSKIVALLISVIALAGTFHALNHFDFKEVNPQFAFSQPWLQFTNSRFSVGMDGLSLLMVLLTNLLMPFIFLSSFTTVRATNRPKLFYSLALLFQAALIGVFTASDLLVYYIFWELALIPIYLIILYYGDNSNRIKITYKFFLYTLIGSLIMLIAIIDMMMSGGIGSNYERQCWLFFAFFIAFAIKMPIFPFHTWQANTYTFSPSQGSMMLGGIMLKMGIYSAIRWLHFFPDVIANYSTIIITLCVIGIVYGAWIAMSQDTLKRLFAYSSLSHVGLIAAGVFTFSNIGLQGANIQMISHGINIVGLFMVAQIIHSRTQTLRLSELGGIIHKAPWFAAAFLILLLGSIALPLTNGFVGEFMLLKAVWDFNHMLGAIAGVTVIFSAIYMLRAFQLTMLGTATEHTNNFTDLKLTEGIVLYGLVALVIFIGVCPNSVLNYSAASISNLVSQMNNSVTYVK